MGAPRNAAIDERLLTWSHRYATRVEAQRALSIVVLVCMRKSRLCPWYIKRENRVGDESINTRWTHRDIKACPNSWR